MPVAELGPERCDALLRFFDGLPEGDLTSSRRRSPTRDCPARGRGRRLRAAAGWRVEGDDG